MNAVWMILDFLSLIFPDAEFQFFSADNLRSLLSVCNIVSESASDFFNALLCEEAFFLVSQINNNMHIRIRFLVMKGSIPFQMSKVYFWPSCNVWDLSFDEFFPCVQIVVAHSLSIFSAERNYMCPDISGMTADFLYHSIQINRSIFPMSLT